MDHGADQFKPNTTVAGIIVCNGKYLLVEELENNQSVYNQPAGHLEANENLITAVKREVLEESGLSIDPDYLSGIYYFHRPDINLYFLRFCFVFELNECLESAPQDDEIIATHWLTYDEIVAKTSQHRSPMVKDCIDDYLAGKRIELSTLKSNL